MTSAVDAAEGGGSGIGGLGEALAGLADERHRFGEDDPDRVADLDRLLVAAALEVEPVDRGDGHVDGELDRVVGPGDLLRALHLLGHLAELAPQLLGVAEHAAKTAGSFHASMLSTSGAPPVNFVPGPAWPACARTDGSATVEHVALAALIALLGDRRDLGAGRRPARIAPGARSAARSRRKIACAPRLPGPCERNPLALAYGFPLGKLVRSLAPAPPPRPGPAASAWSRSTSAAAGSPSCARARARPGLTTSGRRITAFTQVEDRRRAGGLVRVTYWLYRPGRRLGGGAPRGRRRPRSTRRRELRLRVTDVPALVPLETLPGRDHYEFPAGEEPPWRWRVEDVYPG